MIDVLYILGNGSRWFNNELRFSLRSLEKYGKNIGRVFLTGYNPGFLSDKVIYNDVKDIGSPTTNHIHKVKWTFENTDISDDALLNYDDNYLLKEIDCSKYPYYFRGNLPKFNPARREYTEILLETRKYLLSQNKPILNFEEHCPIIYNRKKFLDLNNVWATKTIHGLSPRSIYGNMHNISGEFLEDCKIIQEISIESMQRTLKDRTCFSSADDVQQLVKKLLDELFPTKSKYEV